MPAYQERKHMPKKKNEETGHLEIPDYEAFHNVDEIDAAIQKHKDILVGKDRIEYQIKSEKREYVKDMNEQIKIIEEEREHEIVVLSALEDRKRVLHAIQHGQFGLVSVPHKPAI
jgi:hypothetical protein